MSMNQLPAAMRCLFKQWFHKRNIIIVSRTKVNHIPVSGPVQFCGLVALAFFTCWISYSTGSFMAARSALKEQAQTIRSVATARLGSGFNPMLKPQALPGGHVRMPQSQSALASLDHDELISRVSFLENKVVELQVANAEIIQRVQEKTAGHIDRLETIIEQTGLKAEDLKRAMVGKSRSKQAARTPRTFESQGGPFIPADSTDSITWKQELYSDLDELALLRRIVNTLPLAMPVENAEEQSPFGHRIDPFTGHLAFHSGLDLAGPANAKVFSTGDGTVIASGYNGAYGNAVDIDHGFNIVTRYGHLSELRVRTGDKVAKGQVIGVEGSTGRSTGQHVHYEVRYHDKPMNPKKFLSAGAYVSKE